MASLEEKVNCVLWLIELKSTAAVQRRFRTHYNKEAPHRNSISKWMKKYKETGSVNDKPRSGRPRVSEETVASVEETFEASPRKSLRQVSLELRLPRSTVQKILRTRLHTKAYRIQVHQMLEEDYHARLTFCHQFNEKLSNDDTFLSNLMFSGEATFHINGKVNRHNCHIWGTENPPESVEHGRDSPKINVWCALGKNRVIGPFFSEGCVVNGDSYLEMLQNYFIPQLEQLGLIENIVFQQDRAPCHFALQVGQFLHEKFPNRWIGSGGPFSWPPHSPDLTPLDFFLWRHLKTNVHSTKPRSLEDLQARITDVIAGITEHQLENVFLELQNRITLCIGNDGRCVEN
ncbi:uncharacterized protein LOC128586608 [Nycticebus coucang]|uniref:uncharacterized protein LOC128586608 n=1 Tax=Nycticebus coucang TaxID=9470 RepID=UPI00234C8FFD|nr:uncharacterized protein LOC128586608 [Nycticebus coucang]XP_053448572.1 uncharacterized protein LOC128586608 [Nycticebus coucang]